MNMNLDGARLCLEQEPFSQSTLLQEVSTATHSTDEASVLESWKRVAELVSQMPIDGGEFQLQKCLIFNLNQRFNDGERVVRCILGHFISVIKHLGCNEALQKEVIDFFFNVHQVAPIVTKLEPLMSHLFLLSSSMDDNDVSLVDRVAQECCSKVGDGETFFHTACAMFKDVHLYSLPASTLDGALLTMMSFLPGFQHVVSQSELSPAVAKMCNAFDATGLLSHQISNRTGVVASMEVYHKWWHTTIRICIAQTACHNKVLSILFSALMSPSDICVERALSVLIFLLHSLSIDGRQSTVVDILDLLELVQTAQQDAITKRCIVSCTFLIRYSLLRFPELLQWFKKSVLQSDCLRRISLLQMLPLDDLRSELCSKFLERINHGEITPDVIEALSSLPQLPLKLAVSCWIRSPGVESAKCLIKGLSTTPSSESNIDDCCTYIQEMVEYISNNTDDFVVHALGCELLEALACLPATPWLQSVVQLLITLLFKETFPGSRLYDASTAATAFAQAVQLPLTSVFTVSSLKYVLHTLEGPTCAIPSSVDELPVSLDAHLLEIVSGLHQYPSRKRGRFILEEALSELVSKVHEIVNVVAEEPDSEHPSKLLIELQDSVNRLIQMSSDSP